MSRGPTMRGQSGPTAVRQTSRGAGVRSRETRVTSASRPQAPQVPGGTPGSSRMISACTGWAEAWAPTIARVLLGLVLGWFGYHELVAPGLWTGYVPIVAQTSHLAELLVLAHGWILVVLAAALLAGVAPRLAAMVACLLLVEIVLSLSSSGGLSDLVLRDVGVLGLALAVVGAKRQRLVLVN